MLGSKNQNKPIWGAFLKKTTQENKRFGYCCISTYTVKLDEPYKGPWNRHLAAKKKPHIKKSLGANKTPINFYLNGGKNKKEKRKRSWSEAQPLIPRSLNFGRALRLLKEKKTAEQQPRTETSRSIWWCLQSPGFRQTLTAKDLRVCFGSIDP